MDARLLRAYNQELQHLREMGAEFAEQFPKIAGRLGMKGSELNDPYVERLLEGVAFLTARVQLKLDAEFPRFTQHLLDVLYPGYLAPTPSMLLARVQPVLQDPALAQGVCLPRGSQLLGAPTGHAGTRPSFRSSAPLWLWPLQLGDSSYFSHAGSLPAGLPPAWRKYGGGLRLRLQCVGDNDFRKLALQDLRLFCAGTDEQAFKLHALLGGQVSGGFVQAGTQAVPLDAPFTSLAGFERDEALLPEVRRGFDGYRLLQEYFAFPQRFLGLDLLGLGEALRRLPAGTREAEIVLLFERGDASLLGALDAQALQLHCVPAINLVEQRCDRISVQPGAHEFHAVVDRTRPMDHEIIEILELSGHGEGLDSERRFTPLYAPAHLRPAGQKAYYTQLREARLPSATQQRDGLRSSGSASAYIGSELYLSLVDADEAPYPDALQQLSLRALCSHRDLPLIMPTGLPAGDLQLAGSAPVARIDILKGPSRPLSALREGRVAWRFINQLSLNHLSLLDSGPEEGAAALRDLLRLYVQEADSAQLRQIEGLRAVRTKPITRRLPLPGPIAFGRGLQIELAVDELAFQGGSAYLLGCVLERFFARHVSMNGFTETRLQSLQGQLILAGEPRLGERALA